VVCALISPYADSRRFVRSMCERFVEIHVATPLDECERRDVKGLYARARRGGITQFTGIGDPHEPPEHPELVLDTTQPPLDMAVARVLDTWETATGERLSVRATREEPGSNWGDTRWSPRIVKR